MSDNETAAVCARIFKLVKRVEDSNGVLLELTDAADLRHLLRCAEEVVNDDMFIQEYKLAGPSPKPFSRRPRVSIDGRDIRDVLDDTTYGCNVLLANGARVNVTSLPQTLKNHMVSCVSPAARRAYLRGLHARGVSADEFSISNTLVFGSAQDGGDL